jgi:hypothetical protein
MDCIWVLIKSFLKNLVKIFLVDFFEKLFGYLSFNVRFHIIREIL